MASRRHRDPSEQPAAAAATDQGESPRTHRRRTRLRLLDPADRGVTTNALEVFYDLIFGVVMVQLTHRLDENPTPEGFAVFAVFLLLTWWVWLGWTVYAARFEANDVPHRLLTFAQMLAVAGMAVLLHDDQATSRWFAVAYASARFLLVVMYLRARRGVPETRAVTSVYLRGFGLGTALWAISTLAEPPARFWIWGVAWAVDLATPWLGIRHLRRTPVHARHLIERMATFSSIILYVAVEGVVVGVSDVRWTGLAALAAVVAFSIAVAVWLIYSAFAERAELRTVLGGGQPFLYAHTPVVLGLGLLSVGVRRAIVETTTGASDPVAALMLGGGVASWLTGMLIMRTVLLHPHGGVFRWYCTAAIAVSMAVAIAGQYLPAVAVLGVLAATLGFLVAVAERPMAPARWVDA